DTGFGHTMLSDQPAHQFAETVHLLAASDCGAGAAIGVAGLLALPLTEASRPVEGDRAAQKRLVLRRHDRHRSSLVGTPTVCDLFEIHRRRAMISRIAVRWATQRT